MSERKYFCFCEANCKFETMTKEQIFTAIMQAVENGEIRDVDAGFITKVKEENAGGYVSFWVGTMAQYNALSKKNPNCMYIISDAASTAELQAAIQNASADAAAAARSAEAASAAAAEAANAAANAAPKSHTHDYLPLSGGNLTDNVIFNNGKGVLGKDTAGAAQYLVFLSSSNTLWLGYDMPDDYLAKFGVPIVLTSDHYGATLPTAGTKGRIFFKKV